MNRLVKIDFQQIHTWKKLYREIKHQLNLPEHFGNNLDALYDCLTGYIELPAKIKFLNLGPFHLKKFEKFITVFEDAETELNSELKFSYSIKQDEEDIG